MTWVTQPPNSITSGQGFTVSWRIEGGLKFGHTDVHYDTIDDLSPARCSPSGSPCRSISTQPANNGVFSATVSAPSVTVPTTYYVAAHAQVDGFAALSSIFQVVVSPPADVSLPTVTITSPTNGSLGSGIQTVEVIATDDVGVSSVDLYIDNTRQEPTRFSKPPSSPSPNPFRWSWDTTRYPNGSYTLFAKARDVNNKERTSPTVTVTVNNVAPPPDTAPPTFSSVGVSTTATTATVTWITNEPVTTQVSYGTSPCPCPNVPPSELTLVTAHSYTLSHLAPATTYYFQLSGKDAVGNFGYSGNGTFMTSGTGNTAPRVTLGSPNGGENWPVGSLQLITWNATDDVAVTSVSLSYSIDGGQTWKPITTGLGASGGYVWPVPNDPSTIARVKAVAVDSAGMSGEDGSDESFSISVSCPLPAVPTLENISVISGSYTVAWGSVSGASSYVLEEDTTSSFSNPVRFDSPSASRFFDQKAVGAYYYRVKAVNGCGESSWSATKTVVVSFNYNPGPVTAVSPPDGATNQPLTVNLCWSASHLGGESLRFNVYVAPGDTEFFFSNNLKSVGQTNTCYTAANLPYNTRISWGVEAIDTTGDSNFSPMFHFTTVADTIAPTGGISINNGATTTDTYSVTLYLSASDAGLGIQYMRLSNDGLNWTGWYYFTSQFPWNLADPQYGGRYGLTTYTAYAQFRDGQSNESPVYSDTINKLSGKPGNIILKGEFYEAIQDAVAAANSGDTIFLTEGTYVIHASVTSPRFPSGNTGIVLKPGIALMGAGSEKTSIVLEGAGAAWAVVDADNALIEGVTIINSNPGHNAVLLESNASKIRNCILKGSGDGIEIDRYSVATVPANVEVSNNLLINNSTGIRIFRGSNISILNNTIANNATVGLTTSVASTTITNNIIVNNQTGIETGTGITPSVQYNNVWNNTTNYSRIPNQTGANGNISANPFFVSTTDYHLGTGSPVINAGTNVGIPYAGSAPDLGAFEANATGTIQVLSNRAEASFTVIGPQGSYTGSGTNWSVSNVPLGVYSITFSFISNLYSPSYQARSLLSGQTLTFDGMYAQDTIPPTGTMSVNFDEYATADLLVTLTFDLTDEIGGLGAGAEMKFSNDGTTWSPAEPYSSLKKNWDLTDFGGDDNPGMKTIYGMVSDAFGNWTTLMDTILYAPNRRVLEVPTQYPTIQAAVNDAAAGDVVWVAPGVYMEEVTLKAGVRLQGAGADQARIQSSYSITMADDSIVDGFTLQGTFTVAFNGTSGIVSNNVIKGVLSAVNVSPGASRITHPILRNNVISSSGGVGILLNSSAGEVVARLENNTIVNCQGGGIVVYGATSDDRIVATNNILSGNGYYGITDENTSDRNHRHVFSTFNLLWNNAVGDYGGVNIYSLEGAGDLHGNPLFVDAANGDYSLQSTSPAINSGHPKARYNDPDGTRNDRGAYGGPSLNTSPAADFTVTPEVGGSGTLFTFDASPSIDRESDSAQLAVRWDFDGDGVFDTEFSTLKVASIQFSDVGTFTATMEVMDSQGSRSSASRQVMVLNQPPNPPSSPSPSDGATHQPTTVTLRWTGGDPDPTDTVTYDVYFGTTTNPPLVSSDQPGTAYTPPTLNYHTFYYWRVVAKDNHGNTVSSPVWSFLTEGVPLAQAPSTLTATSVSASQIDLAWVDTAADEIGFKIERKIDTNGTYEQIDSVDANVTAHSDNGLLVNTTYCYQVRAFNGAGDSGPSNEACATTLEGDVDGDGFTVAQGDCNDNNPNIHPGATEVCNGADDNCNGQMDEGLMVDADGDGFSTLASCTGSRNDCNDANATVHPGATEICGDGIDQDCSGVDAVCPGLGLTVLVPNGGEVWPIPSVQTLRWTSNGISGNVKIELSRNGGATWATLFSSTANDGAENWTVTLPATTQARIRICSVSSPLICDISDGNFRLGGGSITVSAPNGGETWPIPSTQTFRWTSSGVGGNVKVELSRNGGATWAPLFNNTANDGVENWGVTGLATTQARIRVSSMNDPSVSDSSGGNFRLGGGNITVSAPNGSEAWPIGSKQTIRWTSNSVGGNVKIELSRNGGSTWVPLFGNTANDGAEIWTVTGPLTTQARFRISSVNDPSVIDISDGNFTLGGGSVTVLAPNGGEVWPIGGQQTLRWNTSWVGGTVKIEVSRNGGASWTTL